MPRDSQRSKFYKAWNEVFASPPHPDDEFPVRNLLKEFEESRWAKTEGYTGKRLDTGYKLHEGKGSIYFGKNITLRLPRYCCQALAVRWWLYLYHDRKFSWHGREYCKALLEALDRWAPKEAKLLRAAFVKHKVKHQAKKNLSEEAKEKLRQRLRERKNVDFLEALKNL